MLLLQTYVIFENVSFHESLSNSILALGDSSKLNIGYDAESSSFFLHPPYVYCSFPYVLFFESVYSEVPVMRSRNVSFTNIMK